MRPIGILATLLIAAPMLAHAACQCSESKTTLEEDFNRYDAAFLGKVANTGREMLSVTIGDKKSPEREYFTAKIMSILSWKGTGAQEIRIVSPVGDCGISLAEGEKQTYLIIGNYVPGTKDVLLHTCMARPPVPMPEAGKLTPEMDALMEKQLNRQLIQDTPTKEK